MWVALGINFPHRIECLAAIVADTDFQICISSRDWHGASTEEVVVEIEVVEPEFGIVSHFGKWCGTICGDLGSQSCTVGAVDTHSRSRDHVIGTPRSRDAGIECLEPISRTGCLLYLLLYADCNLRCIVIIGGESKGAFIEPGSLHVDRKCDIVDLSGRKSYRKV